MEPTKYLNKEFYANLQQTIAVPEAALDADMISDDNGAEVVNMIFCFFM